VLFILLAAMFCCTSSVFYGVQYLLDFGQVFVRISGFT
jgi:hypothetical protein